MPIRCFFSGLFLSRTAVFGKLFCCEPQEGEYVSQLLSVTKDI